MSINLLEVQRETVRHLNEVAALIEKAKMPTEIESFQIPISQLKNEDSIRKLADSLPDIGSYVYWFSVDKPEVLLTQFADRERKNDYKLARDNKGVDSKYVYVGSCTRIKLSSRFKQHCGWGNSQTYSLQLKNWTSASDLTFTFSYVRIEHEEVAVYLEDQLHRKLNPLFGKPGASSKVKTK